MPIPQARSIEIYLLHEIEMRGGSVPARDLAIYDAVAKHFPLLTQDDKELLNVGTGQNKWGNRVEFTRLELVHKGELDGSQRGVWRMTEKGRDRLSTEWPPAEPPQYSKKLYTDRPRYTKVSEETTRRPPKPTQSEPSQALQPEPPPSPPTPNISPPVAPPAEKPEPETAPVSVKETALPGPTRAETPIQEEIISRMTDMSPRQFEEFVGKLFQGLGYSDVEVVGRSGDGGVDVIGKLETPLIDSSISVVCQVKRHKGNVGPSDVGDLRGRWAHRADRLLIINFGGFTQGAREEAPAEAGRKEVSLGTGSELARLMADKCIGIRERPLTELFLDETFWEEFSR